MSLFRLSYKFQRNFHPRKVDDFRHQSSNQKGLFMIEGNFGVNILVTVNCRTDRVDKKGHIPTHNVAQMKTPICALTLLFPLLASAATYNVGPGKAYTTIGSVPWFALAPGDTVSIYPKTAITAVTATASTGTTLTLVSGGDTIPWGSTVWFAGYIPATPAPPPSWSSNWTVSLPWVTCGVQGSGLYGKATGGTACSRTSVRISNAANIRAGTTVYFFPPYFEKLLIAASGTATQHITIQGIPDPTTGVLPALDPHYATTGPNMRHYGNEQYWDTAGFVLFLQNSAQTGIASYLDFKNLRVQGAINKPVFYGASGTSWTMSSLNIRFMVADHVTVQDCEIVDGGDGIFGATNGTASYSQRVSNITLRHNHMWQNGFASGEHQSYMEAQNIVYEYNWYDVPRAGSACSQLKDRSSGTIIRYNWMTPSIRGLDLIAAQNSADVEVPQVKFKLPAAGLPTGATTFTLSSGASQVNPGDTVGYVNPLTGLPVHSITAGNPTVLHVPAAYWTGYATAGQWMELRHATGSCTMMNGVWEVTARDSGTGDVTLALDTTGCSYTTNTTYMFEGYGYPGSGMLVMPTVASVNRNTGLVTLSAPGMPTGIAAGTTLHILSQQPSPYKQTFVYGNVFEWDQSLYSGALAPIVHYGWDSSSGIDSVYDRGGALYFYNNTVIGKGSGGVQIFQTESTYDHVRADNNLFWAANGVYFELMPVSKYATYAPTGARTVAGRFSGRGNQVVGTSAIGTTTCRSVSATGWMPCNPTYVVNDLTLDASGISTKTGAQVYPSGPTRDYRLQPGSSAIGAATALPAAVASNSLGLDLTPTKNALDGTARSRLADIGATEYTAAPPVLTAVNVTPTTASLLAGTGTQQFAAQCSYSNSTSSDCTGTVTWSSSNTAVASISSGGLTRAVAADTATITAASGSIKGTAALTVNNPTLTSISMTPAKASIVAGTGTQKYAAQCSYSNSASADCTATVTWSSSNPSVATISRSGLASALGAGIAAIKAVSGSSIASAALTVTPVPVGLTSGVWAWIGGGSTAPGTSKGQPGTYSKLGAPRDQCNGSARRCRYI